MYLLNPRDPPSRAPRELRGVLVVPRGCSGAGVQGCRGVGVSGCGGVGVSGCGGEGCRHST